MTPLTRVTQLICLLWLAIFIIGCASLPDVKRKIAEASRLECAEANVDRMDIVQRFNGLMDAVTKNPLTKGNKVILLNDGTSTYAAMLRAIDGAKDHINMETYIMEDDEAGYMFADALTKKVREGVRVNLIYDSRGGMLTDGSFFKILEKAGVKVLEFNPLNPFAKRGKWKPAHPDHRKILIVDGKIGIMGGINISGVYSSNIAGGIGEKIPWRDSDVQIEGPAVAELQRLFVETWKKQKGPELGSHNYFPKPEKLGNVLVRIVGSTPGSDNRLGFIAYVAAVTLAQKYIHLTNAYFVPDDQILKALMDAAARGVDVRLVLSKITDSTFKRSASRYNYSQLMEAGVEIYELKDKVLHAKTAVIDDILSIVGSTNLDSWSLKRGDEVDAIMLSAEFAAQMEKTFINDLKKSERIDPHKWDDRKISQRIAEWFANLMKQFF